MLKPHRLFISFARTKETKQRRVVEDYVRKKFAVCIFLPTPVLFSTKQKELASLKQLFVFNAPTLTSASRPKSEAGPSRFLFNIASLVGGVVFASFFLLVEVGVCDAEAGKSLHDETILLFVCLF